MRKQDFELRGDLRPEYTLPRIVRKGALRPEYSLPNVPASKGGRNIAVVPRTQQRAGRDNLIKERQRTNTPPAARKEASAPPAQSIADDATVAYAPIQQEQFKPPATPAPNQDARVAEGKLVQLDDDVAGAFPSKEAVNDALRLVMQLAKIPD